MSKVEYLEYQNYNTVITNTVKTWKEVKWLLRMCINKIINNQTFCTALLNHKKYNSKIMFLHVNVSIRIVFRIVYLYIEVCILYVYSIYILIITIIKCHRFMLGRGVLCWAGGLLYSCVIYPRTVVFYPHMKLEVNVCSLVDLYLPLANYLNSLF